jgi:4-hydroxymandelate oxidase
MDFTALTTAAQERLDPLAWDYYAGVAGGDPDTDADAWKRLWLVPRVLRGLRSVDASLVLGGAAVRTPIMIAATAAHGLAHPDGELATAKGAAAAGALMVYSSSAAVEVTDFGAGAACPWWAQVYLMKDRARSDDYIARCAAAGAQALVLTVDNTGSLSDAPFRLAGRNGMTAIPGNFPGLTWDQMSALIEPDLRPEHIAEVAAASGLPVHVKGVLHPDDAVAAAEAGAAGIVVSNHGRRQVAGVVPTAVTLPEVVAALAGRIPVMVDGGISSGVDVLRAMALGAAGVGVGGPVLWALATAGSAGVTDMLNTLTAELRQAMAAVGAGSLAAVDRSIVRLPG